MIVGCCESHTSVFGSGYHELELIVEVHHCLESIGLPVTLNQNGPLIVEYRPIILLTPDERSSQERRAAVFDTYSEYLLCRRGTFVHRAGNIRRYSGLMLMAVSLHYLGNFCRTNDWFYNTRRRHYLLSSEILWFGFHCTSVRIQEAGQAVKRRLDCVISPAWLESRDTLGIMLC